MKTYICSFVGRKGGAIGVTYQITAEIKANDEKDIHTNLYKSYEHISKLEYSEKPPMWEIMCDMPNSTYLVENNITSEREAIEKAAKYAAMPGSGSGQYIYTRIQA